MCLRLMTNMSRNKRGHNINDAGLTCTSYILVTVSHYILVVDLFLHFLQNNIIHNTSFLLFTV